MYPSLEDLAKDVGLSRRSAAKTDEPDGLSLE
jgi:hypothetical protein